MSVPRLPPTNRLPLATAHIRGRANHSQEFTHSINYCELWERNLNRNPFAICWSSELWWWFDRAKKQNGEYGAISHIGHAFTMHKMSSMAANYTSMKDFFLCKVHEYKLTEGCERCQFTDFQPSNASKNPLRHWTMLRQTFEVNEHFCKKRLRFVNFCSFFVRLSQTLKTDPNTSEKHHYILFSLFLIRSKLSQMANVVGLHSFDREKRLCNVIL